MDLGSWFFVNDGKLDEYSSKLQSSRSGQNSVNKPWVQSEPGRKDRWLLLFAKRLWRDCSTEVKERNGVLDYRWSMGPGPPVAESPWLLCLHFLHVMLFIRASTTKSLSFCYSVIPSHSHYHNKGIIIIIIIIIVVVVVVIIVVIIIIIIITIKN